MIEIYGEFCQAMREEFFSVDAVIFFTFSGRIGRGGCHECGELHAELGSWGQHGRRKYTSYMLQKGFLL